MKNTFKLTALMAGFVLAFSAHASLSTGKMVKSTEVSQSEYKVQLYQVPYSALGVNAKDPRYNQSVKMYFALNESGYYPLMDMLISSADRNPFTSSQILGGFAYVNNWDIHDKNNLTLLNQYADLTILSDNASLSDMLLAKLVADKSYLTGLYYTSKLLDEWKYAKPKEGAERVYSNFTKAGKFFAHEVATTITSKIDKAAYDKVYTQAMKNLPAELSGNVDVQFYMQALFFKDELLRQLTEVALLNTLAPNEIGSINFAADLLIKGMEEIGVPPLLNPYYGKKAERNKDIQFSQIDYTGLYERVYQEGEQLAQTLGINNFIEISPTDKILKGYKLTIFNENEPLNLLVSFNPNGRGLDLFDSVNYYLEYTKDQKYLVMYANPNEGDSQRFIFKKTDKKSDFKRPTTSVKFDLDRNKEDGAVNGLTSEVGKPELALKAWSDVVGAQFDVDLDDAQNAGWSWYNQQIYGFTPLLKTCDLSVDACVNGLNNVSVFLEGFKNQHSIPNQCKLFTDKKISSMPIKLSKGLVGRLWLSDEVDKTEGHNNMLSFAVPIKNDGKASQLCVTAYFYPNEQSINHSVHFSNSLINRMVKGE